MKLNLAFIGFVTFASLFHADVFVPKNRCQTQLERPSISYADVVDRVFQFSSRNSPDSRFFRRRIVLRFLPSWGLETQIILEDTDDRKVRITEYRLKEGTNSISEQYDRVLKSEPKATVEDVIRTLSCKKIERLGGDSIARLFNDFFRLSIQTNLDPDLTLDGTTYELWVQTQSNEIHATFSDLAYGDETPSNPIIAWIKAVREESAKQK